MKSAWVWGALVFALAACATTYDMDAAEPCRQAGYSIAARTQACTGDGDLANARYEKFAETYRCLVKSARVPDFQCAVDVNATDCAKAVQYGDNLDLWLASSGSCSLVLVHADGSPVGTATAETPSVNYQCSKAVQAMMQRVASCAAMADPKAFLADVDARYKCLVPHDPTQPYLEDVKLCTSVVNFPCSSDAASFDLVWASSEHCRAVLGKKTP